MQRYQQQMLLPEIGPAGQEQLNQASVLVVGAGGLGTVVATYLVAMGVGTVGIIDFDEIEETNLHRQFLYTKGELGQSKATVLADKLSVQNEGITVLAIAERLTKENFRTVGKAYTIVCDCTDNLSTRILLDKQCSFHSIPLIHGAVSDWQGYVTVFHHKNKFQYQDLFNLQTLLRADTCALSGVSSPVCGIIGSTMANECLKIILKITSNLDGGLFYADGLKNVFKVLKLRK